MTFGLVVFLMTPVGENQKMARREFQRFLFVGFLNRNELEAAIKRQYPDLTESQLSFIHNDLNEMEDLMTKTSRDITAGMVTVSYEEHEQLAFNAWMDIRIRRAKEWED